MGDNHSPFLREKRAQKCARFYCLEIATCVRWQYREILVEYKSENGDFTKVEF